MSEDSDRQQTEVPKPQIVHTPGPWSLFSRSEMVEVQCEGKPPIAGWTGFDDSDRPIAEHEANARLIAKSPELKDFVELFIREWEETWVDPDEVNHEWSGLYRRAKELIRGVNGGHSV